MRIISNTKKEPLSPAFIVEKAKDHVMFTGTAMIPGEPDCDYGNGEKIFTEQEISDFRQSYKNYGIVDEEHTFLSNGQKVGEPVEDFLLPGSTKMTNIHGEEREYPKGTWVVKTKITDQDLMQKAEKGEIAYSPTVIPEDKARELIAAKGRVLIKDVPDPVVYTLSLTTHPCIDNSCSVKSVVMKEGRSISKENKSILEKARDIINGLIGQADVVKPENIGGDNVTKSEDEKTNEYVTKSDLEEFGNDIVKKFKETLEEPKAIKCTECDHELEEGDKFCSKCGDEITSEKSNKSSNDDEEEGNGSKAIKNHDDGTDEVAFKSVEHYMGRTRKGRPIKRTEEE